MAFKNTQITHKLGLLTLFGCAVACSSGTDGGAQSDTKAVDGEPASETPQENGDADAADEAKGLGGATGLGGSAGADEPESLPQLVKSYPEDGMAGVLPKSDLTFEFDRPMDHLSVEANFSVWGLTPDEYAMNWNDDFTVLTVSFDGGLEYGQGEALDQIVPEDYHVQIDAAAKSQEGVAIEEKLTISFTTARYVTSTMLAVGKLSGSVRSEGSSFSTVWVGDSAFEHGDGTDAQYIGVATFDLDELVGTIVGVDSAVLSMDQFIGNPDPYGELGGVINLADTEFYQLSWAAVQDGWWGSIGQLSDGDDAELSHVVTEEVVDDLKAERFAQFAMSFPTAQSEDDDPDNVEMSNLELTVAYWAE